MASKSRQIHASCAMSSALGDCLDMTLESLVFATQQLETSFNRLNRTLLASSRLSMFLHVAPRTFLHPARVQASRRLRTTVGRKKIGTDSKTVAPINRGNMSIPGEECECFRDLLCFGPNAPNWYRNSKYVCIESQRLCFEHL